MVKTMKFLRRRGGGNKKRSLKARFVRWLLKDVPLDALRVGDGTIDISSTQIDMGGGNITNIGNVGGFTANGDIIPDTDGLRRIGSPTYTFSGAFCDMYLKGADARFTSSGDCEGFIGIKTTRRFSGVYASEVLTSDLMFSEQSCELCGRDFEAGDVVALIVKRIDEEGGGIRVIPVHVECKNAAA